MSTAAAQNDLADIRICRKRVEDNLALVATGSSLALVETGSSLALSGSESLSFKLAKNTLHENSVAFCCAAPASSLALAGTGYLSSKSIKDITRDLLVVDQAVVEIILKWKHDAFDSEELQNLVVEYFRGNLLTIEVVGEVENCLQVVDDSHLLLVLAIQAFVEDKKYAVIVEKLEKFKANGDPFKKRFWALYVKACEQQKSLLDKVEQMHAKVIERRETSLLQAVASGVFWTILGVYSPVVALVLWGLESALTSTPVFGGLTPTLLRNTLSSIEEEHKRLITDYPFTKTIIGSTICAITDLENVEVLVKNLTEKIKSLSRQADEVLEDADAMELIMDMDRMKTEVDMFRQDIVQLRVYTHGLKNDILCARERILTLE